MSPLSLTGKRWRQSDGPTGDLLDRLLALRGIDPSAREGFLHPSVDGLLDGRLMKDVPAAVERIRTAIRDGERIFVCGDYDVDGVVGSAMLFFAFQFLGAKVSVRLPHRMIDGYGLNEKMADEAKEKGVSLIVTVDNGISANAAVARARALGIDVIITDHHLPPRDIPQANLIVNPRQADCPYPFKGLAGAAVGWKLALALLEGARDERRETSDETPYHRDFETLKHELLGLAAIGTIADVCPLVGENRIIVTHGLRVLATTTNAGLRRMYANTGIDGALTEEDIGYRIGPRLNAAGRLDSALTAFQAIAHPTHAAHFADALEEINRQRQQLSASIIDEAIERVGDVGTQPIVIASSPTWSRGVIGLAAGKLAERLYRPVILMEETTDGRFVGSCRCPLPDFNITDALTEVADLLEHFGGHRAAAGFSLPAQHRDAFIRRITDIAASRIDATNMEPTLAIDAEILESDLSLDTIATIAQLAPFGADNPRPLLLLRAVPISDLRTVGDGGRHLSLRVGTRKTKAIAFSFGEYADVLRTREVVDIVATIDEDGWNGTRNVQLRVVDIA